MTSKTLALTTELYEYYQKNTVRPDAILASLRDETQALSMGQMQIAPEQGTFLQFLIKSINAQKTLEVGTFTGYSALAVALALPDTGKIIACDINVEWTTIAQQYWLKAGVSHKIDLRIAPALETLQRLIDEGHGNTFDFAFIDADKENYPLYYELALKLVRPRGVIAVDNVLWYGRVADQMDHSASTTVIRNLNTHVYHDKRVDMCMLPLGDGLTLAFKKE